MRNAKLHYITSHVIVNLGLQLVLSLFNAIILFGEREKSHYSLFRFSLFHHEKSKKEKTKVDIKITVMTNNILMCNIY